MVNVKSPEREFRTFRFLYGCVLFLSTGFSRIPKGFGCRSLRSNHKPILFGSVVFFHIMENVLNIFVVF